LTEYTRAGLLEGAKSAGIALAVSGVLAYPIYRLLLVIKSRQTVSKYLPGHQGKQGTPTMGGIIIVVGYLAGVASVSNVTEFIAASLFFLSFAVIGFVDDFVVPRLSRTKKGLGWTPKLAMQVFVVSLVTLYGYIKLETKPPFEAIAMAYAVILFIQLFYSNAYNFTDGLDGLAATVALAWLAGYVGFFVLELVPTEQFAIGCSLVGSLIPFLVLNARPAKVFMGDVGSLPIGALLGLLLYATLPILMPISTSIDGNDGHWAWAWGPWEVWLAFLLMSGVMIVELVPVPLQILSVKLRKKRIFLKTPIHHALEDKGWSEVRIVTTFALAQLICSAAAVGLMAYYVRNG
jgi:phospho-N-acetylmuramoyl-pentapeptide-transferase